MLTAGIALAACNAEQPASSEPAAPAANQAAAADPVAIHGEQIKQWRQARDARLKSENGWLTLVGLDWLSEGDNRVGSAEDNDIGPFIGPRTRRVEQQRCRPAGFEKTPS